MKNPNTKRILVISEVSVEATLEDAPAYTSVNPVTE